MKIAFIIPVLGEINLEKTFNKINEACIDDEYDIYFALNGKLNTLFAQIRSTFANESRVKCFMVDRNVNEHKLITLGMEMTSDYDATIIYSGKENANTDVIKAFINSWKAGNKIVYLKKEFSGLKNFGTKIKRAFYSMGIRMLGIFKDRCTETDIQLLDQDVVKTINQLPQKNRQLRTLDSFVGYPIDIIQIEIDNKVKENKLYEEKTKSQKVCNAVSLSCLFLGLATFIVPIFSLIFNWGIPIILILAMFLIGILGMIISYVFAIKRTLNYRIGDPVELIELNDLRTKIEKYNIANPKTTVKTELVKSLKTNMESKEKTTKNSTKEKDSTKNKDSKTTKNSKNTK